MIGSGLNRLRRIAVSGGWEVERAWHPASLDGLGADMHAEVAAQRLAAEHGLAPPVLAFDPAARLMRMPWVDGADLEAGWPGIATRRAAMADMLARLRAVPAPALPRLDLPERALSLQRRLAARDAATGAALAAELQAALGAWRQATDAAGPSGAPGAEAACLVHGDLTPGNVRVRRDGSLLLLDFEYAYAGGPWDELAALCAQLPDGALADWVSAVPAAERPLFEAQRRLRRLIDALWYALRATVPAAPDWHPTPPEGTLAPPR